MNIPSVNAILLRLYSSTDVPEYNQKTAVRFANIRFPPQCALDMVISLYMLFKVLLKPHWMLHSPPLHLSPLFVQSMLILLLILIPLLDFLPIQMCAMSI